MTTPVNQPQTPPVKKRKRVFMWFFLAVQAIFLIWIITGASSSGGATAKSCAGQVGQALQTCQDASHVGTGIGVALIIILWCVVDVILGITYLVVRLARRR